LAVSSGFVAWAVHASFTHQEQSTVRNLQFQARALATEVRRRHAECLAAMLQHGWTGDAGCFPTFLQRLRTQRTVYYLDAATEAYAMACMAVLEFRATEQVMGRPDVLTAVDAMIADDLAMCTQALIACAAIKAAKGMSMGGISAGGLEEEDIAFMNVESRYAPGRLLPRFRALLSTAAEDKFTGPCDAELRRIGVSEWFREWMMGDPTPLPAPVTAGLKALRE
jgi:hypothetical protein